MNTTKPGLLKRSISSAVDNPVRPMNLLHTRDAEKFTLSGPIPEKAIKGDVSIVYVIFVTPWSSFDFNFLDKDELKKHIGDFDGDSSIGFVSKLTKTELRFSRCKTGDRVRGHDTFDKAKHNADIVKRVVGPAYTVGVGYFICDNKKKG